MKRNTTSRGVKVRPARFLVLAAVAVVVALLGPATTAAHDLKAVVNPMSDPIRVEAGYDDGTPAEKARVTVTDAAGNPVAAGVLDEKGAWTFPKPGPGSYTVVVEITGHRDEVGLKVPEAAPPVAYSGWRLDKRLGLAIGLVLLIGGTLAVVHFRRLPRTHTCSN